MELVAEKAFTVTESMSGTIQGIALDPPALIPYGAQLVVGFWISDSGGSGTGNIFRPGGNIAGETSDTWLLAPECGIFYRTLAEIGPIEQPLLTVIIDDQGPGPSGDECESAIAATRGLNPLETTDMSDSPDPFSGSADPACGGISLHLDRWYRYVPPSSGTLKMSTCDLANFDAHFEIYRGICGSLEALSASCSTALCAGGSEETVAVEVEGGETYRFRFGSSVPGSSGSGEFLLTWTPPLPFINEIRAQYSGSIPREFIELKGLPQNLDGLSLMTLGSDPGSGSGVIKGITDLSGSTITPLDYHVTAEEGFGGGLLDLDVPVGSLGLEDDTNLTVMLVKNLVATPGDDLDLDDDGDLDPGFTGEIIDSVALLRYPLAASGNQPVEGPKIYSSMTVGPMGSEMPYHVERCPDERDALFAIGPAETSAGGDSPRAPNHCFGPPPNDLCQTAIPLTAGIHTLDTESASSSPEAWDPDCTSGTGGDMQDDVWYVYAPRSHGRLTVSTCETEGWDTDLALYSGDCQNPVQEICNGDAPGSVNGLGGVCQQYFSQVSDFPVVAGDSFLIRVGGWEAGEQGIATLTISHEITGDTLCDAIRLGP